MRWKGIAAGASLALGALAAVTALAPELRREAPAPLAVAATPAVETSLAAAVAYLADEAPVDGRIARASDAPLATLAAVQPVPEPGTAALLAVGLAALARLARRPLPCHPAR